jgi:hypothetical protein
MRVVLATVVAALAAAAPAAAINIDSSVSLTKSGVLQPRESPDKTKSCQAGSKKKIIFKSRHPQVVACEQPPRSNLLTPDSVVKSAAAALSALG